MIRVSVISHHVFGVKCTNDQWLWGFRWFACRTWFRNFADQKFIGISSRRSWMSWAINRWGLIFLCCNYHRRLKCGGAGGGKWPCVNDGKWLPRFCCCWWVEPFWIHPQKLTWNLEMMVSNRNLLFQGAPIFRFHVCFGGCTCFLIACLPPKMVDSKLGGRRLSLFPINN